jgi:phytoene dehydrogenase-like protein
MGNPIVVVGAGLGGLVAAKHLQQKGETVVVLEASDRIGGRLVTDEVEGFRLDRGFQVLFEAYPAARAELDYAKLDFRAFSPGCLIRDAGTFHKVDRTDPFGTALSSYLSIGDKLRVVELTRNCLGMSDHQIWHMPDMSTARYARQMGFSPEFLDRFLRPFFGGIFLDRSLSTSCRVFLFYWKMLAQRRTVIPAHGIGEIPAQLAKGLTIRTGARVSKLSGSSRVSSVVLESGEEIAAKAVVVATESKEAARLAGIETVEGQLGQVCLYFQVPNPIVESPHILLTTDPGLVNMVVPVSGVVPESAPAGKHLVSVTILGDPEESMETLAMMAKAELEDWFPGKGVERWHLLRGYRIPFAQFSQPAGFRSHLPGQTPGRDGLYFAGEFTAYSSINAAMESGANASALLMEDLRRVSA